MIPHGGHLEKWRPYWNFARPAFFSRIVTPIEYLCQICCLYHNLNDSYSYLLHYLQLRVICIPISEKKNSFGGHYQNWSWNVYILFISLTFYISNGSYNVSWTFTTESYLKFASGRYYTWLISKVQNGKPICADKIMQRVWNSIFCEVFSTF